MIAYHGDSELKAALLREIAKHREQDRIVSGTYGETLRGEWVGCAIGCSLRSLDIVRGRTPMPGSYGQHSRYEAELGIPCQLAYLEDRLFERMPSELRVAWPERFASAIAPGADLRLVWPRFAVWILTDPEKGVPRFARSDRAISKVAELYQRRIDGDEPRRGEWDAAAYAAYVAAAAAAYAAAHATEAAYAAATEAAYAAATEAAYAADAAADAADDGASHYVAMADKLIELLQSAPVPSAPVP